jgi:hypothetical protein
VDRKRINISDIKTDPLGDDLVKSPANRLYLELAIAAEKKSGIEALMAISELPLEDRYTADVKRGATAIATLGASVAHCMGSSPTSTVRISFPILARSPKRTGRRWRKTFM